MPRGGKRVGAGRKKAIGRPSGYNPEYAKEATKLCALGATDVEVADFFEISVPTLTRWQNKYPEFCAALRVGKSACDDRIERSLYHRASGYSHEAVKIFMHQGKPVIVPYREHVPPDVGACALWLKNRRKEVWRDKFEHEVNVKNIASELSDSELEAVIRGPAPDEKPHSLN
jgi:hypothetical protein